MHLTTPVRRMEYLFHSVLNISCFCLFIINSVRLKSAAPLVKPEQYRRLLLATNRLICCMFFAVRHKEPTHHWANRCSAYLLLCRPLSCKHNQAASNIANISIYKCHNNRRSRPLLHPSMILDTAECRISMPIFFEEVGNTCCLALVP